MSRAQGMPELKTELKRGVKNPIKKSLRPCGFGDFFGTLNYNTFRLPKKKTSSIKRIDILAGRFYNWKHKMKIRSSAGFFESRVKENQVEILDGPATVNRERFCIMSLYKGMRRRRGREDL